MIFDPEKEGAAKTFDPLNEGAIAVEDRPLTPLAPDEATKKAENIWDISGDIGVSTDVIRQHYNTIMEIPDPDDVPVGINAPAPKVPDEKPYEEMQFARAPKDVWQITAWGIRVPGLKKFFRSDRQPLPPDAGRMEKIDRGFDIATRTPLRTFLKFANGRLFGLGDLMWAGIKRITPQDMWDDEVRKMTLTEAMDWSAGYNPSGFSKTVGEMAEFIGRIQTAKSIGVKTGFLEKLPKGTLIKAWETAKLFGAAATAEQISKAASEKIDPTETEYGYEGPKAVLRDMAIGAALSMATSGVKAAWAKLAPNEQTRALKVLGLKKGATNAEIKSAAVKLAKQYHPDKAKGFVSEFKEVMKARDTLIPGKDVVFRGQPIKITPKLITGEVLGKPIKPKAPSIKTLTKKALTELGKAERPREIIEAAKTLELGKRAARSAAAAERAAGAERLTSALGQLKGELTEYKNPDFTPLKETMANKDIDALHDDIWARPHTEDHFSKINTAKAWSKVVEGFVPTRGEIILLEKQWGKEFAKGLLRRLPLGDKAWDTAADISNFMRTMLAGGDVSVAGRQLRVLGQLYPKEYGVAIKKGLGAYKSEGLAKTVRAEYESSFYHKEAKKYVQFFEPAGTEAVAPADRPEWYMSHYPEKVPVLGHIIRMGNRNYVETMNMMIQLVWDKIRTQDVLNGVEPTKAELGLRGKWLMSMSGRPEIGGVLGKRIAPISTGFFFSPRFAVSRFTSPMYLRHLASGDPVARAVGKKTAVAFASFIGTNIAALALMKLALGDDVTIELDPRSPDWGKGKIGTTRIDLWAGYQQAARFLVQMTLGQYKTQAGEIKDAERLETIGRFVRGKENPLVSLISDLWAGKTYQGDRPFSPPKGEMGKILDGLHVPKLIQGVGKEAYHRMLFLWVQDFADASKNDGWPMGFVAGPLSFFGTNTASYEDTAFTKLANFKNNIAEAEHGKRWKELNSSQQTRLLRMNKQVISDLELQAKVEGARRDDYDYVGRLIEDQKKAGVKVYKKLKPENKKLLDEAGISLGLARKIGDWEIDNKRYERYQEITAEILDAKLSRLSGMNGWEKIPLKRRTAKVEGAVQASKEKAKGMMRREAKAK